ncbi:hypothetical protein Pedsa_3080 [Pseudopedobacter saltans DSM 12145]|uniref:Uncharacterized protein n=1 Tax=Pseudopedobacter saltans (strain ATCC 51119 / DSM 12145 / JCM 21818 / CCUG 39354 / LMG 10337 / NBRC 100064 / NCIMB 13643) TaxID=762903 RepID=F0SA55_PSESL|nr:hypothetical protein [Pseudopedobacter saltans]ADY53619.1 hypothetical protein Pedsa_3080 [Pseudopedobacter saltans DSM 12145]
MRRFFLMSVFVASVFTFKTADAQVRLNVNVNLGSQPLWGPAGYNYVEYYYVPDIDVYYHVNSRKYTYYNGKKWLTVGNLPKKYRNYNFYNGYKVVVNKPRPWESHSYYAANYGKYRGYVGQPTIRGYEKKHDYKKLHNQKRNRDEGHRHHSSRR